MPFLIFAFALLALGERIGGKLCSVTMEGESEASYSYYYITHSLVACIFFIFSGGFSISVNGFTLLYSVCLAASVILSMLVTMMSLRCMSVLGTGILSTPLTLLLTALSGALIWGEPITLSVCLKILVTSVAAAVIFLDTKATKKQGADTEIGGTRVNFGKYVPLMLASVVLTVIQTLITKSFAVSERVTDEHSFYLLTNVVMLVFGIVMLLSGSIKKPGALRSGLSFFKFKRTLSAVGNVVMSNLKTLVTLPLLSLVNVSVFSPVTSAWGIIVGVLVSLIFKERLGVFSYAAAIIATVAIFI